ncbi:unnamed protein product [Periconia digitata]|uniref:Uncharacterized protein n=1 Tax=Periconia digitata TaxID=1303443 RepID=A0A9W4U4U3_9PLEO|nr:unnamed protein product [Periconia digitata]
MIGPLFLIAKKDAKFKTDYTNEQPNPQHITPLRSKLEDVHQGHQRGELLPTPAVYQATPDREKPWKHNLTNIKRFRDLVLMLDKMDTRLVDRICFPLTLDHLIPTVYTNMFRALLTNSMIIWGGVEPFLPCQYEPLIKISRKIHVACWCRSPESNPKPPDTIKAIVSLPLPTALPPSLHPTPLQQHTPHPPWMDIFPIPSIRDAFISSWLSGKTGVSGKKLGSTECALAFDLLGPTNNSRCGGGCCVDEEGERDDVLGLIVWGDPWVPGNWEITERFMRRWGWVMRGCWREVLRDTNKWRGVRGLEPLKWVEDGAE